MLPNNTNSDPATNQQTPDAGAQTAGGSTSGGEQKQDQPKVYTQAELDALFGNRVKHTREQTLTELLKALGVDSIDNAKKLLDAQRQADEAAKTELQKLQEATEKAKHDAEQAKLEKEQAIAQAHERLMRAAVQAEGLKQGFRPESAADVWLLVDKASITMTEQGEFEGVAQAVEKVAKERPFWLGSSEKKSSNQGTPKPQNQQGQGQQKPGGQTEHTRPIKCFTL